MQIDLIGNLELTEIVMDETLLTIRGVRPEGDYKDPRLIEKADSRYVNAKNDPSTT